MCEHLASLENELKQRGIKETFRGQPWSDNIREWVYYDCVLVLDKLRQRYNFPQFVETHVNDDSKSGMEAGFYCHRCKDGVMGIHPNFGKGKMQIE
jgi:hypothetical protein